ncbi:MAG: UDP-N-acetylmuramate--L-alanine ligase [Candidatus Moranbacteria bacterium]|nr:UDP-N-acetylmuramate--L-alanine ligase [Candidatus Moranbacteria bacterium]
MKEKLDFKKVNKIHLIGIKGSAMTALAELLVQKGYEVTGSDCNDTFYTDEVLQTAGIKYFEEFDKNHIKNDIDLIIYSTAYKTDNCELRQAKIKKIPQLSYPQAVSIFFNQKFGIAVCGTHGKTTTSAMLAHILLKNNKDPLAIIGSKVKNWNSSALTGEGKYFVIEADEYQNKLKYLFPGAVILTNVDYDHPDYFKTKKQYEKVFFDFLKKLKPENFLVYNLDDQTSQKMAQDKSIKCVKITISSKNKKADYFILSRSFTKDNLQEIKFQNIEGKQFKLNLKLSGIHNALNALASIAMAKKLGISEKKSSKVLEDFFSSQRRFQKMGEFKGALLFDDYAHHPKEIEVTIRGARERFPDKKIIIGFHPHTFSRTKKFLKEFAQSLAMADKVYVIDIYSSAREKKQKDSVHSKDLVKLINQAATNKAFYLPDIKALGVDLKKKLYQDAIFISMGAGDIWKVHSEILEQKNDI